MNVVQNGMGNIQTILTKAGVNNPTKFGVTVTKQKDYTLIFFMISGSLLSSYYFPGAAVSFTASPGILSLVISAKAHLPLLWPFSFHLPPSAFR